MLLDIWQINRTLLVGCLRFTQNIILQTQNKNKTRRQHAGNECKFENFPARKIDSMTFGVDIDELMRPSSDENKIDVEGIARKLSCFIKIDYKYIGRTFFFVLLKPFYMNLISTKCFFWTVSCQIPRNWPLFNARGRHTRSDEILMNLRGKLRSWKYWP